MADLPPVEKLYRLFAALSERLNEYQWSAQRIWEDKAAVFEFVWGAGHRVAIDVFVGPANYVRVHTVAREEELGEALGTALAEVTGTCIPVSGRGARFEVLRKRFDESKTGLADAAKAVAERVAEVRSTVTQSPVDLLTWFSSDGTVIEYVEREPRRNSQQLIVVLTSIRRNKKWLDFDGPYGESMGPIRARLLFLFDDQDGEYCYHLRVHGNARIEKATLEFLHVYVAEHGYAWSDVILCGMSKGGTAAVCLSAELPETHAIALAPQMRLGRYLETERPAIFRHMFELEPTVRSVAMVDRLVPERLKRIVDRSQRVTIITAVEDDNCFGFFVAQPLNIEDMGSLNLMVIDDASIVDHFTALKYGVPAFLGMLSVYSVGLPSAMSKENEVE